AACGIDSVNAGRAPGYRNDILRRTYAYRSRSAAESTAWHHQDAHSFRTAQAAGYTGRGKGEDMSVFDKNRCEHSEVTCAYAAQALTSSEASMAETHIASCADCQREVESLRPLLDAFVVWPTDVLRPA